MKETIEKLLKEKKELEKKINLIDDAVDAFQKVCDHKHPDGSDAFDISGNDSHYTYYKCEICGYEIKR